METNKVVQILDLWSTRLGTVLSIISFVIYLLEKLLFKNNNLIIYVLLTWSIAASLIALGFLIKGIFLYCKIRKLKNPYVFGHKLSHQLRNAIFKSREIEQELLGQINTGGQNNKTIETILNSEMNKIFTRLAAKLTTLVKSEIESIFFKNKLNEKCRVTIKVVDPVDKDILKWELYTIHRDSETYCDLEDTEQRHTVGKNTAFSDVIFDNETCFFSNDLKKLAADGHYKNTNPDWKKHYNATIVTPIRYFQKELEKSPVVYGILAIDCKNIRKKEIFSCEPDCNIMNIMGTASDLLALWFAELERINNNISVSMLKLSEDIIKA